MPNTDILLASRAKERQDNEEPKLVVSRILILDPNLANPKIETDEPQRMKLRQENEDPTVTRSRMEQLDPNRHLEKSEIEDPMPK